MAIESVKTVWLFDPHGREREFLDRLAGMGLFHVTGSGIPQEEELSALGIERVFPEAAELEKRVQVLRDLLEALEPYAKSSRDFLANFISTPTEVTRLEVERALTEFDLDALHGQVREEVRRRFNMNVAMAKAEERLEPLRHWKGSRAAVPALREQRRTAVLVAILNVRMLARLRADSRLPAECAVVEAGQVKRAVLAQVACLVEHRELLTTLLHEVDADLVEPEDQTLPMGELVARREAEHAALHRDLAACDERLRALAVAHRRRVEVALGYWEERLGIAEAASMLARSKRLTILKGYVRERELASFKERLSADMPDVAILVRDPEKSEAVPVSLRNNRFLAPAQFLVNMFGLPEYFTFDPTPVIFFSFLLFFGFCFGDVLYGALLILMGALLARKYREYPNLRHFFMLLAYAGVPTIVVGALTGSWAGDLYRAEYLGGGNPLLRLKEATTVIDPVDQALTVLVIALMIGMANQLLGIVMLMVRNIRQGDVKSAIYDGGFWLLLLPGVVILVSTMFTPVPVALTRVAWGLVAVGGVGLMLTQGRGEKGLVAKVVVGIASLYGIVGSYGATAFIGDTLSYSRLLALGLTTGIVAMCFNMVAGMTRSIPVVGIVIFLGILIFGHLLNFVLSILGGFVHSARLTFVEFFGRFYQGGAPRFAPLGAWRGRIRVTDADTVWTGK